MPPWAVALTTSMNVEAMPGILSTPRLITD